MKYLVIKMYKMLTPSVVNITDTLEKATTLRDALNNAENTDVYCVAQIIE